MDTEQHTNELIEMILHYHPNCPYCHNKMTVDNTLTPYGHYDFGYTDIVMFPEKYTPIVQLAHMECWQMASDNLEKQ